jgi:hypothetical protein
MVKASDLVKEQSSRDNDKKKIYKQIYKRIQYKIVNASKSNLYECYYDIPEFILNLPLYNMESCKEYLIKKLKKDEFIVENYAMNILWISWKK